MKFSFLSILLILSFSLYAKTENYRCYTSDRDAAKGLGLTLDATGTILVSFNECKLTKSKMFDVCKVSGHNLIIPVNPTRSLLVTGSGENLDMWCAEYNDEPVVAPEPTEPDQEPATDEDENEDNDGDDDDDDNDDAPNPPGGNRPASPSSSRYAEPGHGGSNIRMRGVTTDIDGNIIFKENENFLSEDIIREIILTIEE